VIEVRAPSRLHFGLFQAAAAGRWDNLDAQPLLRERRFGGVGLMVEEPGIVVRAEPAAGWSARGPMSERGLEFARCFAATLPEGLLRPQALTIEQAPPEHCGLGSGTQLALALARALAAACGRPQWDAVELARRVGRGLRSAVGIHGFDRGGLIVEAGKLGDEPVAPLLVHEALPEAWRILVMLPASGEGLHGPSEHAAFDELASTADPGLIETLARLVLLGMLPALHEGDCAAFGEAVYDFNARVGERFAVIQGGRYAARECADLIRFVRGMDVTGVGQSSWGRAVFAVIEDEERARHVRDRVQREFEAIQLWLTRAAGGASVRM
jgi:beta-ribofuranosylaminobenzene 5'-phosphate synthase